MKVQFTWGGTSFALDDGVLTPYREELERLGRTPPVRLVYAAAHLVMREEYAQVNHSLDTPVAPQEIAPYIDWESTLSLRKRLGQLGFGIAEAMDTAQRFQIGWDNAQHLIECTGALRLKNGFIAGAGVDHLESIESEDDLVAGVIYQARLIQAAGGTVILLPLIWLPQNGLLEDDYVRIYGRIIEGLSGPLFIHWLGEMFLPELAGYFPGKSFSRIMALDAHKLRGAKLSLLDADFERRLRRELLTRDQIMLTGDDFNFGELMVGGTGDRQTELAGRSVPLGDFSHGLLGIFDAIFEPASCALRFLAHGNEAKFTELMTPCEVLGRHLFENPTRHYKAGLAFLSYLNGAQTNPMLVQHEERARDIQHYFEAARLASLAGGIKDATLAASRLGKLAADR
ncbi:MAG: hypothetical protein ACI8X5_002962 [Planctomycetota bacterium]